MNRLPLKENLKKYTGISSCPVRNVVARFSGKWSMLILCVLSENDATRFNFESSQITSTNTPYSNNVSRDIQLMASGNSAESAMDCHRRVRGVIAEQIFDSHGCKVGKND